MPTQDIKFDVKLTPFQIAMARKAGRMFPAVRAQMEKSGQQFRREFASARLSGRKGTVGLYKRTGALREALKVKVTGDRLDRAALHVGWLDGGKENMKARVHEYGKTIYGKPWLIFHLLGPRGGDYGWKKVRKVYIPPRLEFRKHFRAFKTTFNRAIRNGIQEALSG